MYKTDCLRNKYSVYNANYIGRYVHIYQFSELLFCSKEDTRDECNLAAQILPNLTCSAKCPSYRTCKNVDKSRH